MRKLIFAAVAAASLLTAVSAANAGTYCDYLGYCYYVPTCAFNVFGQYVCGY